MGHHRSRPARRASADGLHHRDRPDARTGWRGTFANRDIYAWNGNFYALELTERLALEQHGGLLRLGLVHYNTADEVDRLLVALDEC